MYSKIELLIVVLFSLILGYTLIFLGFGDLGTAVSTTALTGFFGLITNKDTPDSKGKLGLSIQSIIVSVCLTLTVIAVITSEAHVVQVVSIAMGAVSGYFGISNSNIIKKDENEPN
jgi:hypothetical protein